MEFKKFAEFKNKVTGISPQRITNVLLAIMTAVLVVLSVRDLFAIQHVRGIFVLGESEYSAEELAQAGGIEYGQPLFSIDVNETEKNVLMNKPYVKSVSIRRWFFSFMTIRVIEDKAKYYLKITPSAKEYYLLSEELRVLDCRNVEETLSEEGLIKLELPELRTCNIGQYVEYGEKGKNEYVKEIIDYVNSCEYGDMLTAIGLPGRFDGAYLSFYGRCKIILGEPVNIEQKLSNAWKIIKELDENATEYLLVDVSKDGEILVSHPESIT